MPGCNGAGEDAIATTPTPVVCVPEPVGSEFPPNRQGSVPVFRTELSDLQEAGTEAPKTRLVEGVRVLLETQRTCLREVESRLAALRECGRGLEAEFVSLRMLEADASNDPANDCSCDQEAKPAPPFEALADWRHAAEASVTLPALSRSEDSCPPNKERSVSSIKESVHAHTLFSQASAVSSNTQLMKLFQEEDEAHEQSLHPTEPDDKPRWKIIIHSAQFDLLVGLLIVLNTAVMSLQLEYNGRLLEAELYRSCAGSTCDVHSLAIEMFFEVMEQAFTALFFLELVVRVCADGIRFFMHMGSIADLVVVLVSSVDSWFLRASGDSKASNIAVLRLVRLAKLSKVLRVVRVMTAFQSLRVLVSAVVASVGALAWSMLLLFILEVIGAIFLSQVLQPVIADQNNSDELRKYLWSRFGTWLQAMYTAFEITMSPGGFVQYRSLTEQVHPLFGAFLGLYVVFVTFAVVRVITALFLKATLAAAAHDETAVERDKVCERLAYARRVEKMVDTNGDGCIDKEELCAWLNMPRMRAWLEDIDLSIWGVERLFQALDTGNGKIAFADFVGALVRMSGAPWASEGVVMLHQSRHMFESSREMSKSLRRMERALGLVRGTESESSSDLRENGEGSGEEGGARGVAGAGGGEADRDLDRFLVCDL